MKNKKLHLVFALCAAFTLIDLSACAASPTQESTGQYVDSAAITAKVKTALLNAENLNSTDISVETYKGVVQLSGFVDSQAQSQLAEQAAGTVPGVKQVKNSLVIKPRAAN